MKMVIIYFSIIWLSLSSFKSNSKGFIPKVGEKAPYFEGKDQFGNTIKLNELLKKGKVVLVFYRGQWCPYCNKHLGELRASMKEITDKGGIVIAVSPETLKNTIKTKEKTNANYALISDEKLKIMKSYHVDFEVDSAEIKRFRKFGIDLNEANGENGATLPFPATFVIGKNGIIQYAFFSPNFKKRAAVKDILKNL
jgi:peroxiredoxin